MGRVVSGIYGWVMSKEENNEDHLIIFTLMELSWTGIPPLAAKVISCKGGPLLLGTYSFGPWRLWLEELLLSLFAFIFVENMFCDKRVLWWFCATILGRVVSGKYGWVMSKEENNEEHLIMFTLMELSVFFLEDGASILLLGVVPILLCLNVLVLIIKLSKCPRTEVAEVFIMRLRYDKENLLQFQMGKQMKVKHGWYVMVMGDNFSSGQKASSNREIKTSIR